MAEALFDAIVVGSGPAGTFAARELAGRKVLVLDVGYRAPEGPPLAGSLYALRRERRDLFAELIGDGFEGLHNLHRDPVSLKLKSPRTSYVLRGWQALSPLVSTNFQAMMSFAQGGLANAWGAGVYRFNSEELRQFPLPAGELEPYYDELTAHIGVSGGNDDLVEFFGRDPSLQPPMRLSLLAAGMLQRYQAARKRFRMRGITLGLPRLAVLTEPHNGRTPYAYDNLEFFQPYNPAIYNPVFTLDPLIASGALELARGWLVTHFRESAGVVEVYARHVETGAQETFRARNLLLGAGTLSTTRIVLASWRDEQARLPVLENPMACIPLFRLSRIGAALDVNDSSLAQLNVVYRDPESGELLQGSLYGTTGPLRSDVLFGFPLTARAALEWSKYLSPAMTLLMMFYPGRREPDNYIRLQGNALLVNYQWRGTGGPERALLRAFRRIGFHGLAALCQYPAAGSSLHYGCTLPMRAAPARYETGADGRLADTANVYVCDGACFSALPAKNLTFTIMANAMRIARGLRRKME